MEEDPLLAVPNRNGVMMPTPMFKLLLEAAGDIKPRHIGIDTSADVFGGNENDRAQVRQFLSMLRKLAVAANGNVVLLAHPSLTGIASGSGISGTTAGRTACGPGILETTGALSRASSPAATCASCSSRRTTMDR